MTLTFQLNSSQFISAIIALRWPKFYDICYIELQGTTLLSKFSGNDGRSHSIILSVNTIVRVSLKLHIQRSTILIDALLYLLYLFYCDLF